MLPLRIVKQLHNEIAAQRPRHRGCVLAQISAIWGGAHLQVHHFRENRMACRCRVEVLELPSQPGGDESSTLLTEGVTELQNCILQSHIIPSQITLAAPPPWLRRGKSTCETLTPVHPPARPALIFCLNAAAWELRPVIKQLLTACCDRLIVFVNNLLSDSAAGRTRIHLNHRTSRLNSTVIPTGCRTNA
jgi:hypothetical protein